MFEKKEEENAVLPHGVDTQALARQIARAALHAEDEEADRIIADFPAHLKEQMPARGSVSGAERLAAARRKADLAQRINAAYQREAEEKAKNEALCQEQRARNVRRAEEAAHYQAWLKSPESRAGKSYTLLHADCDLTSAQLATWKVPAEKVNADAAPEGAAPKKKRSVSCKAAVLASQPATRARMRRTRSLVTKIVAQPATRARMRRAALHITLESRPLHEFSCARFRVQSNGLD